MLANKPLVITETTPRAQGDIIKLLAFYSPINSQKPQKRLIVQRNKTEKISESSQKRSWNQRIFGIFDD